MCSVTINQDLITLKQSQVIGHDLLTIFIVVTVVISSS